MKPPRPNPLAEEVASMQGRVDCSRETFSVRSLTLSTAQACLLLFLADPYSAHCANTNTQLHRALVSRGLIERDSHTRRYCLTDLGRAVRAYLAAASGNFRELEEILRKPS